MNETQKDNIEQTNGLTEATATEQGAAAQENTGSTAAADLGKFKSVDALLQAYNSLQAEFTRRSQRLKELEKTQAQNTPPSAEEPVPNPEVRASAPTPQPDAISVTAEEELYRRANASEKVKQKIIDDYLFEVKKSAVPLMHGGISVISPTVKANSLAEAGKMALGYFQNTH
ncbi:MAG: hypothetical protein IKC91_04120 [Clostridia bacterium]|nr:hypothetical protein [Clostridia bacterium]